MAIYILKRLILAILTLFIILLCSYFLLRLAPGDPTKSNFLDSAEAGTALSSDKSSLVSSSSLREELNLDKPIIEGFSLWLYEILRHGNFGKSATVDPGRPVFDIIMERLSVTVSLNIWAILISYILAIIIGVYSAVFVGGTFDKVSTLILFILYSLPAMWVALMLQSLLSEGGVWPILPLKGLTPKNVDNLSIWQIQFEIIRYYTLPVLCLSYGSFAGLSRYARGGMLNVINSDYIRTARAKGVNEQSIIWHHMFRNSLITLITLFGGLLPTLVAGSIMVEYIFNIPGMGTLSLLALSSRDYPLQMALFAFATVLTLIGIFISDILYMLADPRIKLNK